MKTKTKIVMIVATALLAAGLILGCIGASLMNFNFLSLDTTKSITKTHEITDTFHSISISEKTADVEFLPSEDGTVKVVCTDEKRLTHSVSVENGTLTVKLVDTRRWYDYISFFNFGTKKTTVYLPADVYESVTVKTSTGNVKIPEGYTFERATLRVSTGNVSFSADCTGMMTINSSTGNVKITNAALASLIAEADTGNIRLENVKASELLDVETDTGNQFFKNVTCTALIAEADTGDITLTDAVASGNAEIETDTGNVRFTRADATNFNIKTSTGNVRGSLRTGKVFDAKSGTGSCKTPENDRAGGDCRIRCSTGNIKITIEG